MILLRYESNIILISLKFLTHFTHQQAMDHRTKTILITAIAIILIL